MYPMFSSHFSYSVNITNQPVIVMFLKSKGQKKGEINKIEIQITCFVIGYIF